MRCIGEIAVVILLAAATAGAHGHHSSPAQEPHAGHHRVAEKAKLEWRDDTTAQTITVRLGPLNLPANSDHNAVAQPADQYLEIPFDGWLIAYHPRLTDAAGAKLPGRMLHHVAFWNVSRSDFLCSNKEEHIFGAGGEMNDWPALPGFGYPVAKGERIRVNTMFHNPTDTDYPETYIEVVMEYRRVDAGTKLRSVYPTWFDVQECGESDYDLKPGKNFHAGEFRLQHTGTLLGVGGHLHDYGTQLELLNATREEHVASLSPQLDAGGRIVAMPIVTFFDRGGYRLSAGETMRVTAAYDNRSGRSLPDGAMGIVVGYFLPDNDMEMTAHRRAPMHRGRAPR
ncbi:MAG: hypothetical protein ACRD5G_10050 [Candidatus Acidiferrales bacterium]